MSPEALADIEAIKQLKARYFRFLDTKQWAELSELFTDDLRVEAEGQAGDAPTTWDGRDAFIASLREFLDGAVTTHHGHTPEIDVTGDRATGIWAMFDDLELPHGAPGDAGQAERHRGTGHYYEEYVRSADGSWKIARLVLRRLRTEQLQVG
jgi:hypothetical protein